MKVKVSVLAHKAARDFRTHAEHCNIIPNEVTEEMKKAVKAGKNPWREPWTA